MIAKILSDNLTYSQVNSENPKICFLHGWGGESSNWKNISGEFESIALDIPGFGKSVPFEKSFSPKTYAEYLIDIIPDSVEIIVGHSYGGRIAVHLSRLKKYKKIVVIASPLVKVEKTKDSISIFKVYKFIHKLNLISYEKLEKIKKKYGSEDYKNAEGIMRDSLVKTVNEDLSELLPKIDINVKLIWGEKDVIVPLSIGEEANTKFKDSQLTVFKDAGHNMLRRKSNEITKIIKEL